LKKVKRQSGNKVGQELWPPDASVAFRWVKVIAATRLPDNNPQIQTNCNGSATKTKVRADHRMYPRRHWVCRSPPTHCRD
jgi:hypothetical protein